MTGGHAAYIRVCLSGVSTAESPDALASLNTLCLCTGLQPNGIDVNVVIFVIAIINMTDAGHLPAEHDSDSCEQKSHQAKEINKIYM